MSEIPRSSWPGAPGQGTGLGSAVPATAPEPQRPARKWLWLTLGFVCVLILAGLFFAGLKLYRLFQQSGQQQIVQLHNHMKAKEFAAIFDESDPAYQHDVGRDRSDALFQLIHDHMGDPVSYRVQNVSKSTNTTTGTTEDLILSTTFTKGIGVERLNFRKVGGVWRMVGYHCRSHLLDGVKMKPDVKPKDDNPDD